MAAKKKSAPKKKTTAKKEKKMATPPLMAERKPAPVTVARGRSFAPLAVLIAVVAILVAAMLMRGGSGESGQMNRAVPPVSLAVPDIYDNMAQEYWSPAQMLGQVYLINFFATWCEPCVAEHEFLMSVRGQVPVIGIAYKDSKENLLAWLNASGDPYLVSLVDSTGQTGIDFGIEGVPETYLVNALGQMIYRHRGPVTADVWSEVFVPQLKDLGAFNDAASVPLPVDLPQTQTESSPDVSVPDADAAVGDGDGAE